MSKPKLVFCSSELRIGISIILIIIFSSSFAFTQEPSVKVDSTKTQILLPRFDVHIGAGWVNGGRIGLRTHVNKYFSFEIAYGKDVINFLGASEEEKRYSFGINWNYSYPSGMFASLIFTALVRPNINYPNIPNNRLLNYLMGSLNVGYLSDITRNITFYIRGGIELIRFVEDLPNKEYSIRYGGIPNLDLGIGFSFSLN